MRIITNNSKVNSANPENLFAFTAGQIAIKNAQLRPDLAVAIPS